MDIICQYSEAVIYNDLFFEKYTYDVLNVFDCKRIVKDIDGVELLDSKMIISKFTNGEVALDALSTGCKTALNVLCFPDKVFSIVECGSNALEEILRNGVGRISVPGIFSFPEGIEGRFKAIINEKEQLFSNTDDLESWWVNELWS